MERYCTLPIVPVITIVPVISEWMNEWIDIYDKVHDEYKQTYTLLLRINCKHTAFNLLSVDFSSKELVIYMHKSIPKRQTYKTKGNLFLISSKKGEIKWGNQVILRRYQFLPKSLACQFILNCYQHRVINKAFTVVRRLKLALVTSQDKKILKWQPQPPYKTCTHACNSPKEERA